MKEKATVNESIRMAAETQAQLLGRKLRPDELSGIVAREGLHGELGYIDDGVPTVYNLDDDTRDRLIAHGRQDAAHALGNTINISQAFGPALRRQKWMFRILLVAVALLIYIAVKVS